MKMASSSTLLGVVLAVSMFGTGVIAERMTSVYVTNLPLDEQGNLKVSAAEKPTSLTINVTVNEPIAVYTSGGTLLGEVNVDGWKFVSVYVYWSHSPASEGIWLLYHAIFRTPATHLGYVDRSVTMYSGRYQAICMQMEVRGPILDVWAYNDVATWQSNVTVSLYLTR